MAQYLNAGDLVRVTEKNGLAGYHPGDRGKVLGGPYTRGDILDGPSTHSDDQPCYIVTMDSAIAPQIAVFIAEEIELETSCPLAW